MPCCAGHLLNYCVFSGDKRFVGLGDLNLLKKIELIKSFSNTIPVQFSDFVLRNMSLHYERRLQTIAEVFM